jgi:hypothetical protein
MKNEPEKSDLFIVAKEEDRGEHGRATHVPDTEPGKRVPEA